MDSDSTVSYSRGSPHGHLELFFLCGIIVFLQIFELTAEKADLKCLRHNSDLYSV